MTSSDSSTTDRTRSGAEDVYIFQYTLPKQLRAFEDMLQVLFKLKARKVTVVSELYCGFVHFLSCLYILAIIPVQLSKAGYPPLPVAVVAAACSGIGSIISGLFSNLPIIVAPPTAVSIFLANVILQQNKLNYKDGNQAVLVSGCLLIILGYRPIGRFFGRLIPDCIQASTAVGIGMLTALAGCTQVNLIVSSSSTLVQLGPLTPELLITLSGIIILAVASFYHIRAAFCLTLLFGSITYWSYSKTFPATIASFPDAPSYSPLIGSNKILNPHTILLLFDLFFLYIVLLNGLSRAFSDMAKITQSNGTVPRGRWVYIICGLLTICSGCFGGPPILISPESSAGIRAGARTGLSAVFGGILFCIATFFSPLFRAVPAAGSSPLLIAIGVLLFFNVKKVDWNDYRQSFPAFLVLFIIPFSFSILKGVISGWLIWIIINIFTGDLFVYTQVLWDTYCLSNENIKKNNAYNNNKNKNKIIDNNNYDNSLKAPLQEKIHSNHSSMDDNDASGRILYSQDQISMMYNYGMLVDNNHIGLNNSMGNGNLHRSQSNDSHNNRNNPMHDDYDEIFHNRNSRNTFTSHKSVDLYYKERETSLMEMAQPTMSTDLK
eukprot:gene5831-8044_t